MEPSGRARALLVVCLLIASTLPASLPMAADAPEDGPPEAGDGGGGPVPAVLDPFSDLVARKTSTPPTVDGVVDAVWADVDELQILASGIYGNYDVDIKAMFDDDYIYLLAQYDEIQPAQEDKNREPWELTSNTPPGTWDHKNWGGDRLSFMFEDPDVPVAGFGSQGCDAICHDDEHMWTLNDGETLDAWVWSAAITNDQGYADDGQLRLKGSVSVDPKYMHVNNSSLAWDAGPWGWFINNDTDAGGIRPTHIWSSSATPADPNFMYETDAQEVTWGSFDITTLPTGYTVPGHVLGVPGGDRGDVAAKGVHNGTAWTVEFKRLRDTGSASDTIFDDTNVPYNFSLSVANNVTGADHSKGVAVYRLWLAWPEKPDLVVANPLPVKPFVVNSTFEMNVDMDNIGWADAEASKLGWHWKDMPGQSGKVDVQAVQWGRSLDVKFNVTANNLLAGNNTLVLTADVDGEVDEIDETNNEVEVVIDLEPEPLPNLSIESVTLDPAVPTIDGYSEITVTVENNGTNASGPTNLIIYLDDPQSPVTDEQVPALAIDATHDVVFNWGPIEMDVGSYILNATVDPDDAVRELDETDNTFAHPFDVEAPTLPDLVIEEITPINKTVVQGAETRTNVVVANVGGATVDVDFKVALFLDEAFSVGIQGLMATEDVTEDLPAGANASFVMIWTVPEDTDPGANHFIRAEVDWMKAIDELDEGNNNATFDGLFVVRPKLPDLTVTALSPTSPTVKSETWLRMTVTVENQGNLSSSNTTLRVLDELNRTKDELAVPGLEKGGGVDLEFEWYVTGVSEGGHQLQFLVDPDDMIREDNEFNNHRVTSVDVLPPDLPDLAFPEEDAVSFFPAVPRLGEAVTITIVVRNIGTNASDATILKVELGNNIIATANIQALGVGESTTKDVFWNANEIVTPREYSILVTIDPDNQVKEISKANNEQQANVTFVRPPAPQLDNMTVAADKAEVKDGGTVTLTVSFDNIGDEADVVTIVVRDGSLDLASRAGVTVAEDGSKTETIEFELEGIGEHTLTVSLYRGDDVAKDPDGNDMKRTVVIKVVEEAEDGTSMGIIIAIVVVVLVIVVLAVFLIMRRK